MGKAWSYSSWLRFGRDNNGDKGYLVRRLIVVKGPGERD